MKIKNKKELIKEYHSMIEEYSSFPMFLHEKYEVDTESQWDYIKDDTSEYISIDCNDYFENLSDEEVYQLYLKDLLNCAKERVKLKILANINYEDHYTEEDKNIIKQIKKVKMNEIENLNKQIRSQADEIYEYKQGVQEITKLLINNDYSVCITHSLKQSIETIELRIKEVVKELNDNKETLRSLKQVNK